MLSLSFEPFETIPVKCDSNLSSHYGRPIIAFTLQYFMTKNVMIYISLILTIHDFNLMTSRIHFSILSILPRNLHGLVS